MADSIILGLTGFAGSGKDTVGLELINRGWRRVSFAEPVYALALAIDPIISYSHRDGSSRLSEIVNEVGWLAAKWRYDEVRRILQQIGNEGREIIDSDVWVNIAEKHIDKAISNGYNVVLTDVRYSNEAEMIRSLDRGFVVRVERPGVGPVNSHISDKGLPGSQIDATLSNDGTLDEIPAKVDSVLDQLR